MAGPYVPTDAWGPASALPPRARPSVGGAGVAGTGQAAVAVVVAKTKDAS